MELKEVFEPLVNFLKNFQRKDKEISVSKDKAKERLQLVLMQDRASVSPDFFEKMKKELIEVIKKYIEIDEELLEVQLTRGFEDDNGTGPALYANIPIKNIKPVAKVVVEKSDEEENKVGVTIEETKEKSNEEATKEKVESIDITETSKEEAKENVDTIQEETKEEKIQDNTSEESMSKKSVTEEEKVQETSKKKEETAEKEKNIDKLDEETTEEDIKEAEDEALNEAYDARKIVVGIEKPKDLKQRLNDVKEGVSKNLEKVKTSAKDGIKKIKSKVKAKN